MDLSAFLQNEIVQGVLLVLGGGLGATIITYLSNNVLFTERNLENNAKRLDDIIDEIQKNSKDIGKNLRSKFIRQFELGITYLKENDGVN